MPVTQWLHAYERALENGPLETKTHRSARERIRLPREVHGRTIRRTGGTVKLDTIAAASHDPAA
jgi:hypothetical protein